MDGDWKVAKDILDKNKEVIRWSINGNNETTLHVAVSRRKYTFVKNLMRLMEEKDLELQDNNSYTALSIAVTAGDVLMAKILVRKNKALLDIPISQGMMPIQMAASFGKQDMMKFLYDSQNMRGNPWTSETRSCFLLACLEADCFDVALQVLKDHPELISNRGSMLKVLAQKPQAFKPKPPSSINSVPRCVPQVLRPLEYWDGCPAWKLLSIIFISIAELPWTEIYDIMRGPANPNTPIGEKRKYPWRVLFLAAEVGNIVFIYEVIRLYPELLLEVNDTNQSIFHVAVSCRREDIFGLLYEVGSTKDRILTLEDKNGNNMLHLAGILTERVEQNRSDYIPGAAQKLQRELLLYKKVKSMLPISFRDKRNVDGFTPDQEFTKHHKNLVYEGEKMMKETGAQLMVVAALLATISFAAAITFAGGYNQDKGLPVLRKEEGFTWYMTFICTSFMSASASIINILSLLSSRYAEHDFLTLLPTKWAISVATINISIVAMIGAFAYNFLLLFRKSLLVVSIFLSLLVISVMLYFKLLYAMLPTRWNILRYDRRSMPSYRA
ncbi:Ankyrin repeat-containing protein [Artemisia annua]|uniref:Ankyrin repeat-containing protein n=1 Tax=Artemisia annua TaxID=35608 RepID=A0A2U1P224_ARTAN|nr:Ankyrin repeat-containing protein [Artemisia annua]